MSVETKSLEVEGPGRGRRKRRRSPNRPTPGIAVAFLRMDAIEEFSYPMSLILSELGTVLPVLVSFFIGDLVVNRRRPVTTTSPSPCWAWRSAP
jgi:hypothetical protein